MLSMRVISAVVLLSFVTTPSWAGDLSLERIRKSLAPSSDIFGLAVQQQSSTQQPAVRPPGFDEWYARLQDAQNRRARGFRFMLIGGATLVAGPLIGGRSAGSAAGRAFIHVTTLGGLGVLGYGGWTHLRARERMEDLDREGRINGYLTLAPTPGGVYASAALSF